MQIYPQVEKLHAFSRLGSPLGLWPVVDCQFYMHFCDYDQVFSDEKQLVLNESEFTEGKWFSVDEALKLYEEQTIPIFHPQVLLLLSLKFLNLNYMELKKLV